MGPEGGRERQMDGPTLESCLTLCDSMDCSPPGSSVWDCPCKNTEVGCHFPYQGISGPGV